MLQNGTALPIANRKWWGKTTDALATLTLHRTMGKTISKAPFSILEAKLKFVCRFNKGLPKTAKDMKMDYS